MKLSVTGITHFELDGAEFHRIVDERGALTCSWYGTREEAKDVVQAVNEREEMREGLKWALTRICSDNADLHESTPLWGTVLKYQNLLKEQG